jgi:hypothetical protein
MLEGNSRNANNIRNTKKPATGNHQELKDASNSKNICHRLDASNSSDTSNNIKSSNNYSKDDSNIITAHNSRNTNNIRNESNNRTANTLWTPAKAGMLAKIVKPADN